MTEKQLTPAKSTALRPRASDEQIDALQSVADQCLAVRQEAVPEFRRALTLANGVRTLREMLTPAIMADVMELQGSALGFLTDKDNPKDGGTRGYPMEVVRESLIEAVVRGFRPVGNEFNIIAKRFYPTKQGLRRVLLDWPGMSDLALSVAVPRKLNGETVVDVVCTWRIDGKPQRLELVGDKAIPIRVNEMMGVDAVLGKAKSKAYRAIYELLTGNPHYGADDDAEDVIDVTPAEPEKQPPPSGQAGLFEQAHRAALNGLLTPRAVHEWMKLVSADKGIDDDARKRLVAAGNEKLHSLKRGGQLFDGQSGATEGGH